MLGTLRYAFAQMLDEMRDGLTVTLTPSHNRDIALRGGCIRSVITSNPEWYRRLCAANLSSRVRKSRKPDTRIKRKCIIAALERMMSEIPSKSPYAPALIAHAQRIVGSPEVPPSVPYEEAPF
jgi:hypothetical protein